MAIRTITVPKVTKAFNKNRRPSDLIRRQIEHLKHVAERHPAGAALAAEGARIKTEGQAAAFLGRVMHLLHPEGVSEVEAATAVAAKKGAARKKGATVKPPTRRRPR